MKISNYLTVLLLRSFGCSSVIQLSERQVVHPIENNLYLGSKYKNQQGLLNEQGIPLKPVAYFNYDDFRGFSPYGRIIAEAPYDTEKGLSKIPASRVGLYHEIKVDSSTVNSLSELLLKANSPVLNNFYTGKETYRFVWTRAFHDDYIFELYKQDNQAILHTTRIDKQTGALEKSDKVISLKQFYEFKKILTTGNFWAIKPYRWALQVDGSSWTVEAHVPVGYKVLSRSSPGLVHEDELLLRKAGQWLISRSEVDVTEVY
ncbi:hypothetical protein [Pontibacter harenae]|uniref:hypothetical protein n=1 Tax=Pontibacter harenae TaxID=2894083 RepID=UPI001E3CEEF3|nr:hypothetical protein [Pontibacter harenae]MCC9166538.1 hypothetical protein [Pontibacter harenae]